MRNKDYAQDTGKLEIIGYTLFELLKKFLMQGKDECWGPCILSPIKGAPTNAEKGSIPPSKNIA